MILCIMIKRNLKRIQGREYRLKNIEIIHEKQREYHHKNKEKQNKRSKEWGKQNKERIKEYNRVYWIKSKWLKLLPLFHVSKKETHLYF